MYLLQKIYFYDYFVKNKIIKSKGFKGFPFKKINRFQK